MLLLTLPAWLPLLLLRMHPPATYTPPGWAVYLLVTNLGWEGLGCRVSPLKPLASVGCGGGCSKREKLCVSYRAGGGQSHHARGSSPVNGQRSEPHATCRSNAWKAVQPHATALSYGMCHALVGHNHVSCTHGPASCVMHSWATTMCHALMGQHRVSCTHGPPSCVVHHHHVTSRRHS